MCLVVGAGDVTGVRLPVAGAVVDGDGWTGLGVPVGVVLGAVAVPGAWVGAEEVVDGKAGDLGAEGVDAADDVLEGACPFGGNTVGGAQTSRPTLQDWYPDRLRVEQLHRDVARLLPGLSGPERSAAETHVHGMLLMLAGDAAMRVRQTIADALVGLPDAPRDVVLGGALDAGHDPRLGGVRKERLDGRGPLGDDGLAAALDAREERVHRGDELVDAVLQQVLGDVGEVERRRVADAGEGLERGHPAMLPGPRLPAPRRNWRERALALASAGVDR